MERNIKKEKRFCPFKKNVSMGYAEDGKRIVSDKFCRCAGVRCMAYKNGECLRLQDSTVTGLKRAR